MANPEPFGQVAIKFGFCTQEEVDRALTAQKKLAADGKPHKLIGLILLEQGAISNAQLIQVLKFYEARKR